MKQLTEYQKEFILKNFFISDQYPGSKEIGLKLLEKGECIVAGNECIWVGGIGDFIEIEKTDKYIGCVLYKFDLELFLNSEYYREIRNKYHSILSNKLREIEKECEEIANI